MFAAPPAPESIAAIAGSARLGWLILSFGTCAAILMILGREAVRRWWLAIEDPRILGLFRIVFAALVLADILSLAPHFTFFFTDEGLFASDDAQQAYAAAQFAGYGDGLAGDPRGFFDLRGFLQLFTGPKFSLLYFWDSPSAFHLHLAAFIAATLAFMVGLRTRLAGIVAFLLFNSILYRAEILWEGTEMVFRSVFVLLLCARSGHALSLDNWLRCRRLRREGALSLAEGTGAGAGAPASVEHPRGLAAIYRRIPAWPRRLMMLQTAAIYCSTGAAKSGPIWAAGDALYYALNLEHFYRFPPQALSAALGTTVFRWMTWVTHAWEVLFPLVIVGVIARWRARAPTPAPSPTTRRLITATWWVIGLLGLAVLVTGRQLNMSEETGPMEPPVVAILAWILGMAGLHLVIRRLRRAPIVVAVLGRRLEIGADSLRTWILGRRLWLGLGLVFQGVLLVTMSIGLFQPVMLALTLTFLEGDEVQALLARLRVPGARIPAEDPTLPHLHRGGRAFPSWALWVVLALADLGVVIAAAVGDGRLVRPLALVIFAFIAAVAALALGPARPQPLVDLPLAYGPRGRAAVMTLALGHCLAVTLWLLPASPATRAFREPARELARPWVKASQTAQGWEMFAPDPPTANTLLRVLVIDRAGATWDMNTDVYAPEQRPMPNLGYDRMRKVNRRILATGKRYAPALARYHCRRWALTHDGEPPDEVRVMRILVAIPSPEELAERGPTDPIARLRSHGRESLVTTARCAEASEGQVREDVRARHGLPPAPAGSIHPNAKHRLRAWRRAHPAASPRDDR